MALQRTLSIFVGGSVGSDPYSPKTWSGITAHMLPVMKEAGLLGDARGVTLPRLTRYVTMAKNFHPTRFVWRKHFYFDPAYRRALTRAVKKLPATSPVLMQIGHMFSLPDAFPGRTCISYHDGNLAELLSSGYGIAGVSNMRIEQALEYEHDVARRMSAIFTFSEYLRQSFIRAYGVPASRVFNVGAGINFDHIPEANPAKTYTAPRILFIGIEFERKGGRHLLEAFRQVREAIPSAELHIVGPSQLDNLPDGVIFHGRLSKADPVQKQKLEELFRTASISVLPSLYEPFGLAPLEAMLYQLPAVVTRDWALQEFVTPGVNGELVEKGSADDLAQKMITLLRAPERLAEMGRNGREMVLTRYTWPVVVGRMAEIVNNL